VSTFNSGGAGENRGAGPKSLPFIIDTEGDTVTHDRVFLRLDNPKHLAAALEIENALLLASALLWPQPG